MSEEVGAVYCLCGIEHPIYADSRIIECSVCGQRFDFGQTDPPTVQIEVDGGTYEVQVTDVQIEYAKPEPDTPAPLAELLERLGSISFGVTWNPVIPMRLIPISIDEFEAAMWAAYMWEMRN